MSRKNFKFLLKDFKHKENLKKFPYDFNESDFIIPDFKKISKSRRRESASMGRLSDSDSTVVSGEFSDRQNPENSEGNLSDSLSEYYKTTPSQFKPKEENKYDPERDCDQFNRARTKQKVYVKFSSLKKKRRHSEDSDTSEGNIINLYNSIESDNDDPIREMLKSNILRLYEDNNRQLNDNAIQYNEMKQIQAQKAQYYNKFGWDYNQPNTYHNPIFNVSIVKFKIHRILNNSSMKCSNKWLVMLNQILIMCNK